MHNCYRPLQPTIGEGLNSVISYQEFVPSPALASYVYCYWRLRSQNTLGSPFPYRIVTDGCVDLLINCKVFEGLIVAGTTKTFTVVSLDGELEYFGIRFFPGYFSYFFPLPLQEVANHMIPCQDVWGNRLKAFECRLFEAQSIQERIAVAESFLIQQIIQINPVSDQRVEAVLEKMYQQQGRLVIENNFMHGISSRQLRRLFNRYIGISPKTFSRIVRFQSMLRAMKETPKSEWGKLCFDFGYYDQSHFIHEFEDFYGMPPMSVNFS